MKSFFIKVIKLYQKIPGPWHSECKYIPTCSNYAIEAIDIYGPIKGSIKAFWRILRCNPFVRGGYDPVVKEKKNV